MGLDFHAGKDPRGRDPTQLLLILRLGHLFCDFETSSLIGQITWDRTSLHPLISISVSPQRFIINFLIHSKPTWLNLGCGAFLDWRQWKREGPGQCSSGKNNFIQRDSALQWKDAFNCILSSCTLWVSHSMYPTDGTITDKKSRGHF